MWILIDRESQQSLARQIYEQVRRMVLSGALEAGYKLPSTRKLSVELSVSRNTVIDAYSQLIAEGYLITIHGSGTVVAEGLRARDITLSQTVKNQRIIKTSAPLSEPIDFCTGLPDLEHFPRKEWGNLYKHICSTLPAAGFGYSEASGVLELREEIAQYLYRVRGLSCHPDQIIITSGSTQGLSLVSRLLKDEQKIVLVEDPTHTGLRNVITEAGCRIQSVCADDKGLRTDMLVVQKPVSFIYTTPSHQYPLGSILPIQRRLELVRYADMNDCYIVEDDYDSEFRYEGHPVSSVYELNPQRVIYLGSFSKILAPALRLGFVILPDKLLLKCRNLKLYTDVHSDALGQYVLACFMQNGGFEKYIWKMKKHYDRKRKALLHALSEHFSNEFDALGHATGLHMVIQFHDRSFSEETVHEIAHRGVRIHRLGNYYMNQKPEQDNRLIFGYSHLSDEKIAEGIACIKVTAPYSVPCHAKGRFHGPVLFFWFMDGFRQFRRPWQ